MYVGGLSQNRSNKIYIFSPLRIFKIAHQTTGSCDLIIEYKWLLVVIGNSYLQWIYFLSGAQQPFRIAFKSDAFEYTAAGAIADPASHGFKLRYWQMTC